MEAMIDCPTAFYILVSKQFSCTFSKIVSTKIHVHAIFAGICVNNFLLLGDQQNTIDKTYTKGSTILGSRGWRLTIHEQNTLPAMFDSGFDILPGVSNSISFSGKGKLS